MSGVGGRAAAGFLSGLLAEVAAGMEPDAPRWLCGGCWARFPEAALVAVEEDVGAVGFRCFACAAQGSLHELAERILAAGGG